MLAVERQRTQRLGDALHALALQGVSRGATAVQDGRQEEAHLVDLTGIQERAGELRAALQQDRG